MTRRAHKCIDCATRRPEVRHPDDPTKRSVALTRDQVAIVDTTDYERVNALKWAAHRKVVAGVERFYAVRTEWTGNRWHQIQMSRFILGVTDPAIQVDHKRTHETLNNCRGNLRKANASLNGANRAFHKSESGYKGVAVIRKKPGKRTYDGWRGEITVNGKRMVSPIYRDPETAARWYDEQAVKHFGEFSNLNFPQE